MRKMMGSGARVLGVICMLVVMTMTAACDPAEDEVDAGVDPTPDAAMEDAGPTDPPDTGPPDAGIPCAIQGELPSRGTVSGTFSGASENATTSCTPVTGTPGAEHIYRFEVIAPLVLVLDLFSSGGSSYPVFAIRTACDDVASEVACYGPGTGFFWQFWLQAILEPGVYYVVVEDDDGTGGDYAFDVRTAPAGTNRTCATATPVTEGTVRRQSLLPPEARIPDECIDPATFEDAIWYAITVPPHELLTVSISYASRIAIYADCGASSSCLARGENRYANAADTPEDVVVALWLGGFSSLVPATLDVGFRLDPLASNSTCSSALPLTDGSVVTGDTALGSSDSVSCASTGGAETSALLYYSATIPPGEVLKVQAAPLGGSRSPTLNLFEDCSAAVCLREGEGPPSPFSTTTVVYQNTTASPITTTLVAGGRGQVELTTSIRLAATNSSCGAATPLTSGVMVSGDTASSGTARTDCPGPLNPIESGAHYYAITVPPGEVVGVRAEPTGGSWPLVLGLLDGCSGAVCLGGLSGSSSLGLSYTNTTGAPVELIAVVGARLSYVGGTFDLTAYVGSPPTNTSCATPSAVVDGTTLELEDSSFGLDDLSSLCASTSRGGVLYYSTTIPAGERLDVTASRLGTGNVAMRLLPSCGASSCLAETSGPTLTYTNTGAASEDVVIAIGDRSVGGGVLFDLSVMVGP